MKPPPDPSAKAARDASGATEARAEADALGRLHRQGTLPQQPRDQPAPAVPVQRETPAARQARQALAVRQAMLANPVLAAHVLAARQAAGRSVGKPK
jgi:hypothetical protein